jgi:hypothetical protein
MAGWLQASEKPKIVKLQLVVFQNSLDPRKSNSYLIKALDSFRLHLKWLVNISFIVPMIY